MPADAPDAFIEPGPVTRLTPGQVDAVRALGLDGSALAAVVRHLVADPMDPTGDSLEPQGLADRNERFATNLVGRLFELDPAPLDQPRPPARRVVGTCRHLAVLATAFLRAAGIPARARCGFATYFEPGRAVDHWVPEWWSPSEQRWIRVDPEMVGLGLGLVADPFDLTPTEFLTGGEAWRAVRSGTADPQQFGVAGTDNWGPGEIRGNAMRDLAALHRIEVLPWDEWGPMAASYAGTTDAAFDAEIDDLATATVTEDPALLTRAWARFAVPDDLIR